MCMIIKSILKMLYEFQKRIFKIWFDKGVNQKLVMYFLPKMAQ